MRRSRPVARAAIAITVLSLLAATAPAASANVAPDRAGTVRAAASHPETVAHPNAAVFTGATTASVIDYLKGIEGTSVVSGQHNAEPNSEPAQYTDEVDAATGEYPGIWGGDFLYEADSIAARQTMINEAEQQWSDGSLVTLMWHECPPTMSEPCNWDQVESADGALTTTQWQQLVTDGSALNTAWKNELNIIVPYLQQLKAAGIPVIWRPLHEINDSWSWWGGTPYSATLWQITYNYLVNTEGLTNLIWVWSAKDSGSTSALSQYYPGNQYVDVVALDPWDNGFPTTAWYQAVQSLAGTKPIALAEVGTLPTPAQLAGQPDWTYFNDWASYITSNNTNAQIQATYDDPRVLHQGQIDLPTGTPPPTNLASAATLTAGSTESGFPATNANDGNTSTYWESSDGAGYPQTLTANLGQSYPLGSVTLDLPPATAWSTRTETLSVLGSTNGTTFTTLLPSAPYTFNPSTGNTVSFNLPSGTNDQYLELDFSANTGWTAAQISEFEIFPGTGGASTGSATLTASPTTVAFGSQTDGTTSAAQTVTITDTGTAAASISPISAASPFAESNNCGSSLAAGASCTAAVTFAPNSAGNASGNLTLASSATNSPLTVALTGTGTAPGSATLTASPTSVSFATQTAGTTSAAQTVTISNTGTATASITSIATSAPFAQTTTCGSALAAGASCTVSVTFTPTVSGSASQNLTVTSNATNGSLTVALSGTGAGGSASPTNLALNQPISASSYTQTYVASNANDGNTSTYWEGANGAWPTTLTVNLGASDSLDYVTLDLPPSSAWTTRTQTLSILSSVNDSTWTTLVASQTYTWNPSTGNTVTINLPPGTSGQYIELDITANSLQNGAQLSEFQAWGTASSGRLPDLALNAAATASSYTQTYVPANAVDGNTNTYWEGTTSTWPTTFTVNLGTDDSLGSIVLDLPPSTAWTTRTQTLSILGSTNDNTWTTLVASATYTWNPSTGNTVSINLPPSTTDQYLELNFTANSVQNGAQLSELSIYG